MPGEASPLIVTYKKPGLFDPISQPGGVDSTPPSDLGRGAAKNDVIWHIRNQVETIISRNFHTENQSGFQIMQIYEFYAICLYF